MVAIASLRTGRQQGVECCELGVGYWCGSGCTLLLFFLIINEKSLAFQEKPDPIPLAGEEATFKQI